MTRLINRILVLSREGRYDKLAYASDSSLMLMFFDRKKQSFFAICINLDYAAIEFEGKSPPFLPGTICALDFINSGMPDTGVI